MTRLRIKAEELIEKCKSAMNLVIRQSYGSLDDIVCLDEDDLAGIKTANELMEASYNYALEQSEAMDELSNKLDKLQNEMMEINVKLIRLLERVED